MLANENLNASDRILSLEHKLKQQSDEIVLLKSALADVIRRLQQVESTQLQQNHHHAPATNGHAATFATAGKAQLQTKPPVTMSSANSSHSLKSRLTNGSAHHSSTDMPATLPSKKEPAHSAHRGKGANDSTKLGYITVFIYNIKYRIYVLNLY